MINEWQLSNYQQDPPPLHTVNQTHASNTYSQNCVGFGSEFGNICTSAHTN